MESSSQSDILNSGYSTHGRSRLNGSGKQGLCDRELCPGQLVTQLDYHRYGLSR